MAVRAPGRALRNAWSGSDARDGPGGDRDGGNPKAEKRRLGKGIFGNKKGKDSNKAKKRPGLFHPPDFPGSRPPPPFPVPTHGPLLPLLTGFGTTPPFSPFPERPSSSDPDPVSPAGGGADGTKPSPPDAGSGTSTKQEPTDGSSTKQEPAERPTQNIETSDSPRTSDPAPTPAPSPPLPSDVDDLESYSTETSTSTASRTSQTITAPTPSATLTSTTAPSALPTNSSPQPTPSSDGPRGRKGFPLAAAGVLGAVLSFLVVSGIIWGLWFWMRRRRRGRRAGGPPEWDFPPTPTSKRLSPGSTQSVSTTVPQFLAADEAGLSQQVALGNPFAHAEDAVERDPFVGAGADLRRGNTMGTVSTLSV